MRPMDLSFTHIRKTDKTSKTATTDRSAAEPFITACIDLNTSRDRRLILYIGNSSMCAIFTQQTSKSATTDRSAAEPFITACIDLNTSRDRR
ncbi:hypothetical protein J6590_105733 [Homalodisca vitripennis]|nr:hypothetical protein J6590_105733 [Homalodisca vitripennis]